MRHFLTTFIFLICFIAQPVYAHEQQTAEGVSAILHIDPNDQAVVGQSSAFYLSFKNLDSHFSLNDCNCTSVIMRDDHEIARHQIIERNTLINFSTEPVIETTLQETGDYILVFEANPAAGSQFNPFKLSYNFKAIASESAQKSGHSSHIFPEEHIGHIIIFGGGFAFIIGWLIRDGINKKNKLSLALIRYPCARNGLWKKYGIIKI